MNASFTRNLFTWLTAALLLAACRAPVATPAADTPTPANTATRNSIVLPTLLPTLTPRPTYTPSVSPTLLPSFTTTATRPPATATPTPDPNATATATPTQDAITLYQQSSILCEAAFAATAILTTTQPGGHLPIFSLINRPYESTYWDVLQGMEWIEAEIVNEVRAITCIRESRRQDATYNDQTVGYTLRWDVRLLRWPDGLLFGETSFWGEGPPLQKTVAGSAYGAVPNMQLLTWLACTLQPKTATILCQSGGPLAFQNNGHKLVTGKNRWNIADTQLQATYPNPGEVSVLALSPDGRLVASANRGEREIHLWLSENGQSVRLLSGHSGEVTALAFSPEGRWLLSASQDGSLRRWDVQSGQSLFLAENLGWLHAVAISSNGKLAAAATWSQPGLLTLWDWQAALLTDNPLKPLHILEASEIYINALAFSPDNLLLACAGLDGNVKLWDVASALDSGVRLVGLLQGHADSVTSLAFSPDGKSLASGSADRSVLIWDVISGTSRRILPGAPDSIIGVVYSPDGTWLAVSSAQMVRIWSSP